MEVCLGESKIFLKLDEEDVRISESVDMFCSGRIYYW